jgi:hypothetical protein
MGRAVLSQEAVDNVEGGSPTWPHKGIPVGTADDAVAKTGGLDAAIDTLPTTEVGIGQKQCPTIADQTVLTLIKCQRSGSLLR